MGPILALMALSTVAPTAASRAAPASSAATPSQSGAKTPQQLFDAATTAITAGRWQEALDAVRALKARPPLMRDAQVAEAVLVREARALLQLGHLDEADAAAREAAGMRPDQQAFQPDRLEARILLAALARRRFDYPTARGEAEKALAIAATPDDQFNVLVELTRITMFDPGAEPIAYADRMVAVAGATGASKKLMDEVHTLHARALIVHDDVKPGYVELQKVLAGRGGLTQKISLSDAILRADLAMAALLSRDQESARKYLANTGAGRIGDGAFAAAVQMVVPPCGGQSGIRPDDFAVVEFGIGEDGSVTYAIPVYASRLGSIAPEFAQAVSNWSWRPEEAAKIPAFYRAASRVELRCSTAAERPPLTIALQGAMTDWLRGQGVTDVETTQSDAARAAPLKTELARREEQGETVGLIPVLLALGSSPVLPFGDRLGWLTRAEGIATAKNAPFRARAFLRIMVLTSESGYEDRRQNRVLRDLLAQPDFAADAEVAGTIKLMVALPSHGHSPVPDAAALLQAVADDPKLLPTNPLKVGALIRLASLQYDKGDAQTAQATYKRSGLSAQQCSLVDAQPLLKSSNASSSDYPAAALNWGFEGWVRTEFDIGQDGHTIHQRAVIAYPPFVFRDAAIGIAKGMQFRLTYRPEGGIGCGGASRMVRFSM